MTITLRQMQAFVAVARLRNFTRAAETLRMAQPMVSNLIGDLEAELGFKLFDRTTRRVDVTDAATEFLHDAEQLMRDMDGIIHRAQDVAIRRHGRIAIGAPPLLAAALLPQVIDAFRRSSPGVSIKLVDRPVATLYGLLKEGEIHLAVGTFGQNEVGLSRIPLISDTLSLLCRSDHPLAKSARPRWRDLKDVPLVALRRGSGIREQLERGFADVGIDVEPAFELDQVTTVIAMVERGFGVSVLPLYALSGPAMPSLVARPLHAPSITRKVDAVYLENRSLSPASREFGRILQMEARQLKSGPRT